MQKPFAHIAYFITTKEKRGDHTSDERKKGEWNIEFLFLFFRKKSEKYEKKTILYNIDKVVKNVLANNRGKNKKNRIVIYFSFFVYDIGLLYPNKRKKGE